MLETDLYSAQQAQINAEGYSPLRPTEKYGRLRFSMFSFNTGSGGVDVSTFADNTARIGLLILPANSRLIKGVVDFGAMGSNADLDLGLYALDESTNINDTDTVASAYDNLLNGIDVSSAGRDTFADLESGDALALQYLEKQTMLVATALTADWAADKVLKGYVLYVVD